MDILPEHAQIIEKLNEEFSDLQDDFNSKCKELNEFKKKYEIEINVKNLIKKIINDLDNEIVNISRIVYFLYKDKIKVIPLYGNNVPYISNYKWYYFNNDLNVNEWTWSDEETELLKLRKYSLAEISFIFKRKMIKYEKLHNKENNKLKKKNYKKKELRCGKIICKLKNSSYKDKIINACKGLFCNKLLYDIINIV